MREDHDISHRVRRKDSLSAGDLSILLQWHWKYGASTVANERQRVRADESTHALLCLQW
jgi:hypothetical protein